MPASQPPQQSQQSQQALQQLWALAGLPADALAQVTLTGQEPVLPSSFLVGVAAQAPIAAAALAACELAHLRGVPRRAVAVDMMAAAMECTGWFSIDGKTPDQWDAFSGLYRAADGWVRIHANFAHHRDGALSLLGLDPATATRADAERQMLSWKARDYEDASAAAKLVATALRSFDEWDASPQGQAVASQPLFSIERIGDAPPLGLPPLDASALPLAGLRVLDLTRILAGPVGGRTLAAYGADVMLVNSPRLPNITAIADTSRGKLSALADLADAGGREALARVVRDAHVFVQGYRPGGLEALGFGPAELARLRPGIVCVSLSAYGAEGPWRDRRGFDSLVQTAMGFNRAEGDAMEGAEKGKPRPMPMQILDVATGHLIAMTAAAALHRQQREGGSWLVRLSLAQTGQWLRSLGRNPEGLAAGRPDAPDPWLVTSASGFGELRAMRHSADLGSTSPCWPRPSMPPGTHPLNWP